MASDSKLDELRRMVRLNEPCPVCGEVIRTFFEWALHYRRHRRREGASGPERG